MGSSMCYGGQDAPRVQGEKTQRTQVTRILQDFPTPLRGSMFRGSTTRYSNLSVLHEDYNRYIFVLHGQGQREMRVVLPVLNELAHRALHPNYKVTVGRDVVIDPFDDRLQGALIPVRNQISGLQYSMRVVRFKGYNSGVFKRTLQEIWLYQNMQRQFEIGKAGQDPRLLFHWLEDYYVYGINADQQAVVLLYERTQGSLLLGAEYRSKANWAWSRASRLRIMRDLLLGCVRLQELGIVHRDIRASNILYLEKGQRYVLGGFGCAREAGGVEEELLTVCGVEGQSEGHLKELIAQRQNMGLYRAGQCAYSGLKGINRLLQSLRIADELSPGSYTETVFTNLQNQLSGGDALPTVLKSVEVWLRDSQRAGELGEQANILRGLPKLVPQWYKQLCQDFQFAVYCALGYQLQFSEMAHRVIQKNNLLQHPFQNAWVLRELGLFYQKYGTGGSQYLLNSCVLYCKQAQSQLQRGLFDDAQTHLEQGEDIYIRLSTVGDFSLSMIQLKQLRAQLRARTLWRVGQTAQEAEKKDILELMGKTLTMAGELNLPIQKQMRMFLTWGVVLRECGEKVTAEERFRNGLAVCQNAGAFESQAAASLAKSHFLYELSSMQLQAMREQHDPLKPVTAQTYTPPDLPKSIETALQQCSQLRQREATRGYQVAQCSLALGELYMLLSEYLQANVQFKRALVQLQDIRGRQKVPMDTMVQLHYDLGSVNYRLQDYEEAVQHYREAVRVLEEGGGDKYWASVISGNLGLALLRVGQTEKGKALLDRAKETIKSEQGSAHYDYLFLNAQQELINQRDSA